LRLVGAFTIPAAARSSRFVFLVAACAFLELAFARAMVVLPYFVFLTISHDFAP
jgi:hypothetical protein